MIPFLMVAWQEGYSAFQSRSQLLEKLSDIFGDKESITKVDFQGRVVYPFVKSFLEKHNIEYNEKCCNASFALSETRYSILSVPEAYGRVAQPRAFLDFSMIHYLLYCLHQSIAWRL